MSESLSTIANIVVALAAVGSTWILWKTFKSVNAQTEISGKQFEVAMRRQEEPDLTATPGDFAPFGKEDPSGRLTIAVLNCGAIPLRELRVKLLVAASKSVLAIHGPLSVSPGRSQVVRGLISITPQFGSLDAEIVCEFETPIGRKFRKRDRWNLSYYKERGHELVKSSPVEEIVES
jgi:hypothetical protein